MATSLRPFPGVDVPSRSITSTIPVGEGAHDATAHASSVVCLLGAGSLASSLARRMATFEGIELRAADAPCAAAVSTCDAIVIVETPGVPGASASELGRMRRIAPVIPVRFTARDVWIGPILTGLPDRGRPPATAGCARCAALHLADRGLADDPCLPCDDWPIDDIADRLIIACCNAIESARGASPVSGTLTTFDFVDHATSVRTIAQHHDCAVCFPSRARVMSGEEAARRWWEDAVSSSAPVEVPLRSLLPTLRGMTGPRFGLLEPPEARAPESVRRLRQFLRARGVDPEGVPLARAHAYSVLRHESRGERCIHRVTEGFDFDDPVRAEALAILEGLERLYGLAWCDPSRLESGCLGDGDKWTLDPRECQPYSAAQLADSRFPLQRFDPGRPIAWRWGWDLTRGEPCRVAADLVVRNTGPEAVFAANSTGAACHSDVRRAVVNGILETVERDAFMLTWLLRRSMPRIAFASGAPDPGRLRETFGRSGLDFACVDITTDLGIPTVLGVLRDCHDPDFQLVDMVAATRGARAVEKLHREIAQFASHHLAAPGCFANDCTRSDDPEAVSDFPDHAGFYQRADRIGLTAFLTASSVSSEVDWTTPAGEVTPDVELADLLARLAAHGHRVVVVDCTPVLLRRVGLHVVKVLIPGLQPLNAGHRLRALGGERLRRLRDAIGDGGCVAPLNPWPHPFW